MDVCNCRNSSSCSAGKTSSLPIRAPAVPGQRSTVFMGSRSAGWSRFTGIRLCYGWLGSQIRPVCISLGTIIDFEILEGEDELGLGSGLLSANNFSKTWTSFNVGDFHCCQVSTYLIGTAYWTRTKGVSFQLAFT